MKSKHPAHKKPEDFSNLSSERQRILNQSVQNVLTYMGDDPEREGLKETPKRYLKFMNQFCSPDEFDFKTFENEGYNSIVVQSNIPFFSLCEHHLAPFFGTGSIAYIPEHGRICGLSKLARTLDYFARRPQNQERLTMQVAEFLCEKLATQNVAVLLTARHLCVEMRGIKKYDTWTTTNDLRGGFKDDDKLRAEFFQIIK